MAIRPISVLEFVKMMERVKPPVGWSDTLAVANSGGPDSTCLLFLLSQYLDHQRAKNTTKTLPRRLVSLTVDHNLQPSSDSMANHAARTAEQLGVQHFTTKLPWGEGNYPTKPGPEDKIEERARDLRYTVLLDTLINLNANSLALGHHLDDQVETMLMRLGRGSNIFGLAGMRPCRRWGMGTQDEGHLVVRQLEKMQKWLIRPLLSVGKDRIIATCEAHNLDYVTDRTNFQPQLTIRNAIRHLIREGGSDGLTQQDFSVYPHNIARQLADINTAAAKLYKNKFNLASDLSHLRDISSHMTANLAGIDASVDRLLENYKIPSPPGTFMISPLSLKHIAPQAIREAFLYRVVRYISPYPWGSPKSELGRRKASVGRLLEHLWNFQHLRLQNNTSLCVGSGVLWKLVATPNTHLRTNVKNMDIKRLAWIAFRQPPPRPGHAAKQPSLFSLDVTDEILQSNNNGNILPHLQIVFDGRFLIKFQVQKLPKTILESLFDGGRIVIEPHQSWASPQVIHVHRGEVVVLYIHNDESTPSLNFDPGPSVKPEWVSSRYIRSLSAI